MLNKMNNQTKPFCADLKAIMNMKANFIRQWGMEQLVKDASVAEVNVKPIRDKLRKGYPYDKDKQEDRK